MCVVGDVCVLLLVCCDVDVGVLMFGLVGMFILFMYLYDYD